MTHDKITGRFLAPFSEEEAHERISNLASESQGIERQIREHQADLADGPPQTEEEQEWEQSAKDALSWKEQEAGRLRAWLARQKGGTMAETKKMDRQSLDLERQRLNMESKLVTAKMQQSAELARLETERVKAGAAVEIARLKAQQATADREIKAAHLVRTTPRKPPVRCLSPDRGDAIALADSEAVISALRGIIGRWRKAFGAEPTELERVFLDAVLARVRSPEPVPEMALAVATAGALIPSNGTSRLPGCGGDNLSDPTET